MNGIVADNQKVGEYARWENKSDAKIKRNAVLSLAANLEIQDQEKLKQRRSRLAALIANEEEGYKNELATCQETSVQKVWHPSPPLHRHAHLRPPQPKQHTSPPA
jgi:hypothetical protein